MSTTTHQMALPPGYVIDNYCIETTLGNKGGFGITYLARDQSLHKKVAIKELMPDGIALRMNGRVIPQSEETRDLWEWALDAFKKEARVLATFKHPNIVQVHRLLEANGTAYIVMEFLDGQSLESYLDQLGPTPTEEELQYILKQIMDGLEAVHAQHLIHRDIKPENIYVTRDGRIILLDFGAARPDNSHKTTAITQLIVPGYSPFEQYQSNSKLGPTADIYSAAATMCRAISGKRPPVATDRITDDEYVPVAQRFAGRYSDRLLAAIDKGLALRPKDRPQSVAEWRAMVELPRATIHVQPPPIPENEPPPVPVLEAPASIKTKKSGNGVMIGVIASMATASAALLVWVFSGNHGSSSGETEVETNSSQYVSHNTKDKDPLPVPKKSEPQPSPVISVVPSSPVAPPKVEPPIIRSFTLSRNKSVPGAQVELRWNVERASEISISTGIGVVQGSSVTLTAPSKDTSYTLTARNSAGYKIESVNLRVGPPPEITYFTAPNKLIQGLGPGELKWSVSNSASVKLNGTLNRAQSSLTLDASKLGSTPYELRAENEYGVTTQTKTVEVVEDPWNKIKVLYENEIASILNDDLEKFEGTNPAFYNRIVTGPDGATLSISDYIEKERKDNANFNRAKGEFLSYWVELVRDSYDATADTVKAKQFFFFRRFKDLGSETHGCGSRVVHFRNVSKDPKIFRIDPFIRGVGQKITLPSGLKSSFSDRSDVATIFDAIRSRGQDLANYKNENMLFAPMAKAQATAVEGGTVYVYKVTDLPQGRSGGNFLVVVRPYKP